VIFLVAFRNNYFHFYDEKGASCNCKDMVRMMLVVVSLVCQLRELVSIV
jgi:hypothetical protein